jgi:type IV secretion system protein TrbF
VSLWRAKAAVAAAAADSENSRVPNPYLDGRRHWNSEVDRAFSRRHRLELLCVVCLLIALGAVGGVIYIGSKSKYVPYVIEVDKLGEAVAVGPAQLAAPADPRVVRASLASFISSARLVTPDVSLQREAIFRVYGMLKSKDPATQKMNEWYNGTKDVGSKDWEKASAGNRHTADSAFSACERGRGRTGESRYPAR